MGAPLGQSPAGHHWVTAGLSSPCSCGQTRPVMQEKRWSQNLPPGICCSYSRAGDSPPPHPSLLTPGSGNEELGAQRCGFVTVVLSNCIISRSCFDASPKAPLLG